MTGWIARTFRGGRYSMNLRLLEADLLGSSALHRAGVILAAASMLESLRTDDLMTGMLLHRAVTEPFDTSADAAEGYYNTLEEVLTTAEKQSKALKSHTTTQLGTVAAGDLDGRVRVQQQGMRLLLVALARKVDDDFKAKARRLREPLFEVRAEIENAVEGLKRDEKLFADVNPGSGPRDFVRVKTTADLIAFAILGW